MRKLFLAALLMVSVSSPDLVLISVISGEIGFNPRSSASIRGKALHAGCARGSQRQEILCPADWLAHATQQLLQVSMVLHEIDIVGIHHQQV